MQIPLAYFLKVSRQLREYWAFLQTGAAYLPAFLWAGFYIEGKMNHLLS
jgi:hypothetical protein